MLATAKKKKGIIWEDCKLSFFEDMTKERVSQRKLFHPMMKVLWQHQVKHTLAHPATLRFTWRGKWLSFTDAQEAENFIHENIEKTVNGENMEVGGKAVDGAGLSQ